MQLHRVVIRNFRSIENATIKFEPRCRVLIGKNEVGKSNLLSACALLDRGAEVVAADLRESRDEESPVTSGSVMFVFRLTAKEIKEVKVAAKARVIGSNLPLCEGNGKSYGLDEFVEKFNEWIYSVSIPRGTRGSTYWTKNDFTIAPNWLIVKPDLDESTEIELVSGKIVKLADISFAHASLISEKSKDHFKVASMLVVVSRIASLVDKVANPLLPSCMYWKYADANLLPQSINIEAFKSDPKSCEPLRAMFILSGEVDPAAAIERAQQKINGLKNLLTRVARLTTAHVQQRWKEIDGVEIVLTPNGAQIDAAVKDQYNEYAFERRSDGFKRFISFLILVSARSAANDFSKVLFIQDEPDLGLHPSGVKSLLQELIHLSIENIVLISTHSIFMVDKERIDRHVIVKKERETTVLADVDRSRLLDEEVLFNALGYSLFEIVKKKNILFEGWRDKKLFQIAIKKRGKPETFLRNKMKSEIGMTHAMGVKDIAKAVTYFDVIERDVYVVTDSDAVAIEKQQSFLQERNNVPWKRYDQLTGEARVLTAEDFIKPVRLAAALQTAISNGGYALVAHPDLFVDAENVGVVKSVQQFLEISQVPRDSIKELVNTWKSEIFDSLEIASIADAYSSVVESVARDFGYEE